ncbi:DUF5615 family PIN-like protein [Rhodocaloribacter litoris]|uniref:DUF5615 family PIN-like protein n=1 Tax=Rhodocaloribacter litoris TaxID=2558931 RepID=UPI001421DDA7|nr:DUF5615 family PIN-like protein [Rhodocaloribacter litoris]QXD17061.1 DUF5615 family PIN-like protein [Rhodocaloribacter litoris]
MKFLVDAQLPHRLSLQLRALGHDAVHTLDLPLGNRTPDAELNRLSMREERVLITKDTDFVDSLIVKGVPHKLLLVATGNIPNAELERLFLRNLETLITGFADHVFIEIDREAIRFHF